MHPEFSVFLGWKTKHSKLIKEIKRINVCVERVGQVSSTVLVTLSCFRLLSFRASTVMDIIYAMYLHSSPR